jgi:hypothetical protein
MPAYDAFISYSHAKDKPIAAALQSVVQHLGKPWYRLRALRVFRDDTSLAATPELWPSIERALGQSRFMVLLASAEAVDSPWVGKEVAYWLQRKSVDTFLIAVTDGRLSWDESRRDFAWTETTPLPHQLKGHFRTEPKWVDMSAYRISAAPRDAKFIELAANFAAAIHGKPKEDLLSEEVREQRRALTLAVAAIGLLLLLGASVTVLWGVAEVQRKTAQTNFETAENFADSTAGAVSIMVQGLGTSIQTQRKLLEDSDSIFQLMVRAETYAPRRSPEQAIALVGFSEAFFKFGNRSSALARAEAAKKALDDLDHGALDASRQHSVAIAYARLGMLLMQLDRPSAAEAALQKGLAVVQNLAQRFPDRGDLQEERKHIQEQLDSIRTGPR